MKKFFKILGCIILAALLAVGYIAYVNRGNIESFITAMKYNDEEIDVQIQKTKETLKTDIDKYFEENIRDFTEEEEAAIQSGEKSAQKVLAEIILEAPKKEEPNNAEAIIAKYTSKILDLEGTYVGQIEGLLLTASREYWFSPPEQQTLQNKVKIMTKYVGTINELEASCDKEVESYISSMEKELKAIGADTSVAETARQSYKNEKKLRKAAYLKRYAD